MYSFDFSGLSSCAVGCVRQSRNVSHTSVTRTQSNIAGRVSITPGQPTAIGGGGCIAVRISSSAPRIRIPIIVRQRCPLYVGFRWEFLTISSTSPAAAANNSVHGKIFITPKEPGKRRSHSDTAGTCALSYSAGPEVIAVYVPAENHLAIYDKRRILRIRQTNIKTFLLCPRAVFFCSYDPRYQTLRRKQNARFYIV